MGWLIYQSIYLAVQVLKQPTIYANSDILLNTMTLYDVVGYSLCAM